MRNSTIGRAVTFAGAARCYWLEIFPVARRELREWRRRAEAIPEPGLRRDALLALQTKSGNAEGLAAFAVLAPRGHRRAVVRAVIAYQTTLDYLDSRHRATEPAARREAEAERRPRGRRGQRALPRQLPRGNRAARRR